MVKCELEVVRLFWEEYRFSVSLGRGGWCDFGVMIVLL